MIAQQPPLRAIPGGKVLPHSAEAEASVLGGVMLRNEVLRDLEDLEELAFYDLKHRVVFGAMRNLEAAHSPIDTTTLENEIARQGKLDAIGGVAFLGELVLKVPSADNVVSYAKIVNEKYKIRQIALIASAHAERAYGWEDEADEFFAQLVADMARLDTDHKVTHAVSKIITIDDSLAELRRLAATPVFETPFPALNKTLGFDGLLGGQVYYLAGGTGFGKTSFIATLVLGHAQAGRPALIAFYEMFSGYYTARMSSSLLGMHANRIIRGDVDHDSIRSVLGAAAKNIEMLEEPTMAAIKRVAEGHVRAGHGPPLIVVDYVQLLGDRIMATMQRPDARLANAQASAGLRQLAKETGAAIIAVSAAGRSVTKELMKDVRKRPARDLIDASRESGSIEFDGAGVIVLSVSDEKDAGGENIATISVAKARFGETAHIDARYMGATGAWRSLERVTKLVDLNPKPDDGSLRGAILGALAKSSKPVSKSAIARATNRSKPAVLSEMDIMQAAGLIAETKGGFVLVETNPTPPHPQIPGWMES